MREEIENDAEGAAIRRALAGAAAALLTASLLVGCRPAATVAPADAEPALQRIEDGHALVRSGRYGAAAEVYATVLEALPPAERAATAAVALGADGPRSYRRLLASLHANLGLCDLRRRQFEDAAARYEEALSIDPGSLAAQRGLGLTLLHLRRYPEAARQLEHVVADPRATAKDHLDLGRGARHTEHRERARWALRRALHLARRQTGVETWGVALEARRELAAMALEDGRAEAARRWLDDLLADAPGDAEARFLLTRALTVLGHPREAELQRRRFEDVAATHAAIQVRLLSPPVADADRRWVAERYAGLGLLHLAHTHFLKLQARAPDDASLDLALREIHLRAGRRGQS
jgi:tetratricopeptide (TPR) repeat protein